MAQGNPITLLTTIREIRFTRNEEKKQITKYVKFNYLTKAETHRSVRDTCTFMRMITLPGFIRLVSWNYEPAQAEATLYSMVMPNVGINMKEHIAKSDNCIWDESELAAELDKLIDLLAEVQRRKRFHGQITLEHILVDEEDKLSLISWHFLSFHPDDLMQLARKQDELYLSPIRREMKRTCKHHSVYDPYKSDVYSLGICFLIIIFNCNEKSRLELRDTGPERFLAALEDLPELSQRLAPMLEQDENARKDFIDMNRFVHRLKGVEWEPPEDQKPLPSDPNKPPPVSGLIMDDVDWGTPSNSSDEDEDEKSDTDQTKAASEEAGASALPKLSFQVPGEDQAAGKSGAESQAIGVPKSGSAAPAKPKYIFRPEFKPSVPQGS